MAQTFDNDLQVVSESVNAASTVTYAYDRDGLMIGAGPMAITRDASTPLVVATSAGTVSDARGYNAWGEPTSYSAQAGTTPIYVVSYTRDGLGRIASKTETTSAGTQQLTYTYDAAGRLTDVYRDAARVEHYAYDANDNRVSGQSGAEPAVAGTYDAQDRLLQYGAFAYTYNAAGQLESKTDTTTQEVTTYDYDVRGNLKRVQLPGNRVIEYLVDAANRRVARIVDGQFERGYLWSGTQLVAELDENQVVAARFVYATEGHSPDLMIRGGSTYRFIKDQVGSPRFVVDVATGAVAQTLEYDSFGRLTTSGPGLSPFGFAGGLYDPDTGLVRFGARDYDARTGRWTSKDPIRFSGGDGNAYVYVRNAPTIAIDPTGLILNPADIGAQQLLDGLGGNFMGRELIDYIEASDVIVNVMTGRNLDSVGASGLAGNLPIPYADQSHEGRTCGGTRFLDIQIADVPSAIHPWANLAHELVHAALYINATSNNGPLPFIADRVPSNRWGGYPDDRVDGVGLVDPPYHALFMNLELEWLLAP